MLLPGYLLDYLLDYLPDFLQAFLRDSAPARLAACATRLSRD